MSFGDVFDALADPVRRDLLLRLADGPERVVDLTAHHDISRPAISRHLRVLGEAGLVTATDQGRERHYALERGPLGDVARYLDRLGARRPPIVAADLEALDTEVHRARRDRRNATTDSSNTTGTTDIPEERTA